MHKILILVAIAFFKLPFAVAAIKANCANENTFLKLNEVRVEKDGSKIAEIFMNFKDLNRILNLPEVSLRDQSQGYYIREKNGTSAVLLRFTETVEEQTQQKTREVSVWVKLDGKKIRENIKLKCEK
jgi:hypothetical protein